MVQLACPGRYNSLAQPDQPAALPYVHVLKLLADVGQACALYQDRVMNNLKCERIECDEIWSFVGAKQRNVNPDKKAHADYGDCYTFTAIDPVFKVTHSCSAGW